MRTVPLGARPKGFDGQVCPHVSGTGVPQTDAVLWRADRWEAARDTRGVQLFVRQAVASRRLTSAEDDTAPSRTDREATTEVQQLRIALGLELSP